MLPPQVLFYAMVACWSPGSGAADDDDTAANHAPSAPGVAIEPQDPVDGDDLVCQVTTPAADPDGDPVSYRYSWTVDGADAGIDISRVTREVTREGDTWTCGVIPTDGLSDGLRGTASVVIAGDPPPNQAPTAPTVEILPASPRDADALVCRVVSPATDPEGDEVTYLYAWTVDGADAGVTDADVPADRTATDETWTCSVRASDGVDVGLEGTASVTIASDFRYSFVDGGWFRGVSCVTQPQFVDLTGDGRLDLLCTDVVDRMAAMEREGTADSPSFTGFWYVEHPGCCGDALATLTAGELQAGALPSVLVAYGDGDERGYSGNVKVYPNRDGVIAEEPSWSLLSLGLASWSQAARTDDVDGDGSPELLITSLRPYTGFRSDGLRIVDIDPSGAPTTVLWSDDTPAVVAATADIDGDGRAELLACGTDHVGGGYSYVDNADAWAARLYAHAPTYTLTWSAPTTEADGADEACAFADFDGDGDLDVVVLSDTDSGQGLRAFENVDGQISATPVAQVAMTGRSLDVADWDGDGRDELLVGTSATTTVVDLDRDTIEASVTACGWGRWFDWNEDGAPDMACMATNGVYAYRAE